MLTREGALTSIPDNRQHLFVGRGDGIVFAGLLVAICLLPLVKGGNREWLVMWFSVAIFALLALWSMLFAAGRVCFARAIGPALPIISLWLLWLAYLVLQNMSWPVAAVESSAPFLYEHYSLFAVVNQRLPDNLPFTVSTGESRLYLVESLGYFFLFVLVLLTVRGTKRRQCLAMTLVFSGLFQALYGTLFLLSGLESGWFGDVASPHKSANGTFINRNHFAGYLQLTAALGVGLVLADLTSQSATHWRARFRNLFDFLLSDTVRLRVVIALMVIALVLSRSRMGNIAFFNALAAAGLIYILLRERRLFFKATLLFATFFLVDLFILGNWFGLDELVARLEATRVSTEARVNVFPDLRRAAESYWPFGSGGGTFYAAFTEFRSAGVSKLYYHAHNDYMEFLIETGIFGVLLLGGVVALAMIHALRLLVKRRDRLVGGVAFAGIMATIAMAIHATVDFNLQIPANAATYVVILGLVMSCSVQRRPSKAAALD